jgi:hypothetical protein
MLRSTLRWNQETWEQTARFGVSPLPCLCRLLICNRVTWWRGCVCIIVYTSYTIFARLFILSAAVQSFMLHVPLDYKIMSVNVLRLTAG